MPSYLQLQQEPVWQAQYVPGNLDSVLIGPLRAFFKLGPALIGAPGDNNHVYGRHRSANWDRGSIYCLDRAYGTTDARDHRGDQDIYRAVDTGITGQQLYDASRRMDSLVRSGKAPGVAEWFGTFDGVTVVGWYEGHPSSSDDSHLTHLHVGFWNESANDPATLQAVYGAITGTGKEAAMAQMLVRFKDGPEPSQVWLCDGMLRRRVPASETAPGHIGNDGAHNANMLGNLGNGGALFDSLWSARESWGAEYPPAGGGSSVSGPVDLTDAALDKVEERAFSAAQRAERE